MYKLLPFLWLVSCSCPTRDTSTLPLILSDMNILLSKMSNTRVLLCFIVLAAFAIANASGSESKERIGVYALKKGDLSVKFTNWGATIISLVLPDKNGLCSFLEFYELWFYLDGFLFLEFLCSLLFGFPVSSFLVFAGKLADVVLGYDSVKEYTVSFLFSCNFFLFSVLVVAFQSFYERSTVLCLSHREDNVSLDFRQELMWMC